MKTTLPTKKELEKHPQFFLHFVATKNTTQKDSEFVVLNKDELIDKLQKLLPYGYGYTILIGEKNWEGEV